MQASAVLARPSSAHSQAAAAAPAPAAPAPAAPAAASAGAVMLAWSTYLPVRRDVCDVDVDDGWLACACVCKWSGWLVIVIGGV